MHNSQATAPMISVIVPVYNAVAYLHEAVQSILNQTYTDFELILINDGSTDDSLSILRSFSDPRVQIHENPKNMGLIDTLNKGLSLARGKYIARMDADDISLPERFAKQVEYLEANPSIAVLGANYETIDSKPRMSDHPTDPKQVKEELLFTGCILAHPTVMIRRAALESTGLRYDRSYTHFEDYALWAQLSKKANLANLSDVLLKYRCHPTQVSTKYGTVQERGAWLIQSILLAELLEGTRYSVERAQKLLFEFRIGELTSQEDRREVSKVFSLLITQNKQKQTYSSSRLEVYLLKRWLQSLRSLPRRQWVGYLISPWMWIAFAKWLIVSPKI